VSEPPVLVVRDDAAARGFAPFAGARAWGTMPAGPLPIAERWGAAFPNYSVRVLGAPWLAAQTDADCPPRAEEQLPAGTIVAESRAAVALAAAPGADAWTMDGHLAAVRLSAPVASASLPEVALSTLTTPESEHVEVDGAWLTAPWDLLTMLERDLAADLQALLPTLADDASITPRCIRGPHAVLIEPGAVVEPYVVFDTTEGPIVLRSGARVAAFTRLAGPLYVGPRTQLLGGRIGHSVLGPECRVHGDVHACILAGYVNKAHEGFVGHSVIGRWANLGAGTTTSNLKNSYGTVRAWTPRGEQDTGRLFLGSLIGEHAKFGIGTMLGTGTVVGPGANVFGTLRPPKVVPPFAWGDAPPYETFSREKFVTVAERVMARRAVVLSAAQRETLGRIHDILTADAP
jgi:UDP-N-acetylglucosamine diphosphorylase/glucosamine-1-phosphate N-acetyltransferase